MQYNMSALDNLYKMQDKDIDKFAHTLASAFKGYALFEYFAKYKYDEKKMISFWKVMLKASKNNAIHLATDEECESVAVVFKPGYKGPSLFSYIRYGGIKLLFNFGLSSIRRMLKFEIYAETIKKNYIKDNTWYFYSLAVSPSRQNKGEASKLVRPLMQFWKDNNQTCYLETLNSRNVSIYQHFDYKLVSTTNIPSSDLILYGMVKE